MVRMGNVWDRTVEVLNGRGGMLAGLAILSLFVPAIVVAAFRAYVPMSTPATLAGGGLTLLVTLAALWGQLAIIAASSDPATDRAAATAAANRRLLPAIGVALMLAVLLIVAMIPAFVLFFRAGLNWAAISAGTAPVGATSGAAALGALYVLALCLVLLFAGSRLLPIYAVVLHERRGTGAIARCWRLTRRHTWRLLGVVILFLIVAGVATLAAQSVVGLVVRLILGGDAVATVGFAAAVAGQAVSTALTLLAIVFTAQLYDALVERERRLRERAAAAHPGSGDDGRIPA
jgi:hypothetical protein